MKSPEKIDLHMHTTVSDGTDTPEEILTRVKEAGITLFAVSDHDAVKGSLAILRLRTPEDPAFLTGAEFSCKDEEGKYHILGYGYDPDAKAILRLVQTGHRYRIRKVLARLDFIKNKFGFDFPPEELDRLLAMDNPGKPHIANLMVRFGYAKTKEQAIEEFINKIRFRSEYIRPEEAVEHILAAGGIPVLAHPTYGDGDQLILGEDMDRRIRRLTGFGLQGVEAFYSGFTKKMSEEILGFAERYGLYATAGSDYHGKNKLVVLGDTGLGDPAEGPACLHRFLDAIRDRL